MPWPRLLMLCAEKCKTPASKEGATQFDDVERIGRALFELSERAVGLRWDLLGRCSSTVRFADHEHRRRSFAQGVGSSTSRTEPDRGAANRAHLIGRRAKWAQFDQGAALPKSNRAPRGRPTHAGR
eukprot:2607356-Prymnesium_polylepis.1